MKPMRRRSLACALSAAALMLAACGGAQSATAREIHSNGLGGGRWTDAASWHGAAVPTSTDVVVIATGDTIVFDGNDINQPSCRQILIDPRGTLTFKADNAQHTLNVAGSVEAYGMIRMEGALAPSGTMELRLTAPANDERVVRLLRDSALIANGAEGLPEGGRNVIIAGCDPAPGKPRRSAAIKAGAGTMLDIRRARMAGVVLEATAIDNTGFKPNERLNLTENQFVDLARIVLNECDTPSVQKNTFEYPGQPAVAAHAIKLSQCRLAEIKDNIITGRIDAAIAAGNDVDSSATGNTITGARCGISWHGQNAMLRANEINDCLIGVYIAEASGVLEGLIVRRTTKAISAFKSPIQITDFRVEDLPTNGIALSVDACSVTVLNANLATNQISLGAPPAAEPWVQTMQYLIVQVKGQRPPNTLIEACTAAASGGPPKNAADLNVRNSPAKLSPDGLTPLPRSLRPLIIRSWSIDRAGKKVEAPFYDLVVTAPAAKAGEAPRVLKSMTIEPKDTWFRPAPNQPEATVEVVLP